LHTDAAVDAETVAFKINVLDNSHAAPGAQKTIDAIEHARADMERSAFDQVRARTFYYRCMRYTRSTKAKLDLNSATDFFQRELEAQVQLQMNECVGIANGSLLKRPATLRGFTRLPTQVWACFSIS